MKIRGIHMDTKRWLAVMLVLALLPRVLMAYETVCHLQVKQIFDPCRS